MPQQPYPGYRTNPSLFKAGVWRFLTTKYGISDGIVFSRQSFLGVPLGSRPEIDVEHVTRVQATGTIFGDIIFGEGSHDPVIWKGVWNPERVKSQAKQTIDRIKELRKPPEPPWHTDVELEKFAIVTPGMPGEVSDWMIRDFGTPFGINLNDERNWAKEGEPIGQYAGGPGKRLIGKPRILAPCDGKVLTRSDGLVFNQDTFRIQRALSCLRVAFIPAVGQAIKTGIIHSEFKEWAEQLSRGERSIRDSGRYTKADYKEGADYAQFWLSMPLKIVEGEDFEKLRNWKLDKCWHELPDFIG